MGARGQTVLPYHQAEVERKSQRRVPVSLNQAHALSTNFHASL